MVCVGDLCGARGGLNNIFEFTVVQLVLNNNLKRVKICFILCFLASQ